MPKGAASDHPVIGVNWFDANVYASWLAERTGLDVRLPQQHEWVAFAADHAPHPKPKLFTDPRMAWAANYDITARIPDSRTRPARDFGQNNVGLFDLKGNVWEWTATDCADAGGRAARAACNGGGRMVMGEHLAILSDLVRDPGNASCGGGIPPSNLGFRVVY